jgi:hypothetical protein
MAQAGNLVISSAVSDYMDGRRILDHLLNSIEDDSIHDGRKTLLNVTSTMPSLPHSSIKEFNS